MSIAFTIEHHDRVPRWVGGLHVAFANWLTDHYPILHTITVYLVPNISMPTNDGRRCWGFFNIREKEPTIVLACGCPRIKGRLPDRDIQVGFLLGNFAHEFCHYERWRDGRPNNHRGIENRVDGLLRRFYDWTMPRRSDATNG